MPNWLRRFARAPFLIGAMGALVFVPSLFGEFIYDDVRVIVLNEAIRDLRLLKAILLFEPSRPLLTLTWALNYAVHGLSPFGFHLVNAVLHGINAALVCLVVRKIVDVSGAGEKLRHAAVWGGAFFAISPMAVEAVAYIASRSSVLAATFSLLFVLFGIDAIRNGGVRRIGATLACLILGLAVKEEAAAAPLMLLVVDLLWLRERDVRGRVGIYGAATVLMAAGLVARRALTGAWLPSPAIPHAQYLWTQWTELPGYFFRAVFPWDPAFYRFVRPAPWPGDGVVLAKALGAFGLCVSAVLLRRRWPAWSGAVALLVCGLLPSSSVVPLQEMVVDHRAYLGSIGIALMFGTFLAAQSAGSAGWRLVGGLVIASLAVQSVRYQRVLRDSLTLWTDVTNREPDAWSAWNSLGDAYRARQDRRAEEAYRRAATLAPRDALSRTNLGVVLAEAGDLDGALAAFGEAAERSEPHRRAKIYDNMGMILAARGDTRAAIDSWTRATVDDPRFAQPRLSIASALIATDGARAQAMLDTTIDLPMTDEERRASQQMRDYLRSQGFLPAR